MSPPAAAWVRPTLLALLLVALALLCVAILAPFITPIVWAAILAYASWPLYRMLLRAFRGYHTAAALLMTLILGCAVVLPVLWIAVVVQRELLTAYQAVSRYLAQGPPTMPAWLANIPWLGGAIQDAIDRYASDPAELPQQLSGWILGWSSELGHIMSGVTRNVVRLSLTLLTLFFFYRDGQTIARQADQVIEGFFGDRLNPYVVTAGRMTRAVVYGLVITAITQGVIAGIGYWVLGVSAPVLLAVMTGILSIVPLIGTAIVWVPVGIYLMSMGMVWKGIIMLLWGALLVHPADNVLRPILISNATRVPFLIVMFGALGGLEAFGLVGVFAGPVVLAVALAIWREWAGRARP
ncbi:MAG TPA: AI-2E family transporter [Steroidobacteraceae bacterium]|jgi:predicted PurR-regulated permease PerM